MNSQYRPYKKEDNKKQSLGFVVSFIHSMNIRINEGFCEKGFSLKMCQCLYTIYIHTVYFHPTYFLLCTDLFYIKYILYSTACMIVFSRLSYLTSTFYWISYSLFLFMFIFLLFFRAFVVFFSRFRPSLFSSIARRITIFISFPVDAIWSNIFLLHLLLIPRNKQ